MKEVVKCTNWCEDRMLQSADEIERLAKHSANVEEQYSNYHEWATAEIERLTESLRQREDQLRISLDEQRAPSPPAGALRSILRKYICDCRNESTDDPDKHGVHCRYHIEMRAVLTKSACCRQSPCLHPGVGPCDMPAVEKEESQ